MRKFTSFILLFAVSLTGFAQLKVATSGKVGIGVTGNPNSDFAVGGLGSTYIANYFQSNKSYLMNLKCIGDTANPSNLVTRTGLRVVRTGNTAGSFTGIKSDMLQSQASTNGTTIGILGIAGNANTNYGVHGKLQGSKSGAAIMGEVSGNTIDIDRKYAGYFAGDVGVSKDLYAEGVYCEADERFLIGQAPIDSAINRLEILNPVKWAWPSQMIGNDPKAYMRYAISGQDVEQVFPLLVRSAPSTFRYVDYVGLIPVLVQAIKDLNSRIVELEENLRFSRERSDIYPDINQETVYTGISLQYNALNSFNGTIEICYTLPDNVSNAYICIFDMRGTMKKRIQISSANDRVTFSTETLSPGIYLYSLVVNGQEVVTKRMVVSK